MRYTRLIGGAAAILIGVACSESTSAPGSKASDWSGAVIKVAAADPNAQGELRGVVVDSILVTRSEHGHADSRRDGRTQPPDYGAAWTGSDTAFTTVTKIGEVVTDANGRFLVTSIPQGQYQLVASPPAGRAIL